MTPDIRHISATPDAESLIVYMARVSNPASQERGEAPERLIKYLVKHRHWSPFEMADLTVEINTSRAIAAQILRHRSFTFQEFSQRYSAVPNALIAPARRQAEKNRQSSVEGMSEEDSEWWKAAQHQVHLDAFCVYNEALKRGIAKELARFVLPLSTSTRLYMHGNVRSWIHYIALRTQEDTQKEHRDVALGCKSVFKGEFPIISEALGWNDTF